MPQRKNKCVKVSLHLSDITAARLSSIIRSQIVALVDRDAPTHGKAVSKFADRGKQVLAYNSGLCGIPTAELINIHQWLEPNWLGINCGRCGGALVQSLIRTAEDFLTPVEKPQTFIQPLQPPRDGRSIFFATLKLNLVISVVHGKASCVGRA